MQWKDIIGHEGFYQISDMGIVRSLDRFVDYKHGGKKRFWPGQQMGMWKCGVGYYTVVLKKSGIHNHKMIHRLVAQHFIDNPLNLPQVNHKDNNKLNNNVENLEWCDQFQNVQHAFKNGFHSGKGGTHYLAKPVVDTETNKYYGTLREAAEENGYTLRVLGSMLTGQTPNRTKMRYL